MPGDGKKRTTRKPKSGERAAMPEPRAAKKAAQGKARKRPLGAKKTKAAEARPTSRSITAARQAPAKKAPKKKAAAVKPAPISAPMSEPASVVPAGRVRIASTHPEGVRAAPATSAVRPSTERHPKMELHWGDPVPRPAHGDLVDRWTRRGDELLRLLDAHDAATHEYRADLKEGRFVWIAPDGRASAEATAQVLCSWSRSTSVVAMAWADPLVRAASVPKVESMPAERDGVDEETAWRVAMEAAERSGARFLYRVPTPHAWYFLALSEPRFDATRAPEPPSTPAGLVLRVLGESRQALESRAEPSEIIRMRLEHAGAGLLHQADFAYRTTDWVARLERSGRTLLSLAHRLPRASYRAIAAGKIVDEWPSRELAVELLGALSLLEDEWALFS
jgi:hypothetical protein